MIPRKSDALRLAPPTRAPFTSLTESSSRAFDGLHRAAVEDAHAGALGAEARGQRLPDRGVHAATSPRVGVSPVPMAHTGS